MNLFQWLIQAFAILINNIQLSQELHTLLQLLLICYKINVRTKKVSINSCKHFVLVFLRIFLDSFQNFHCWFHSRFSSLINFNIWYTITASLRHVDGFPVSVFTAFPVNSGSSDYYGSSVTIWDIQCHLSCLTA